METAIDKFGRVVIPKTIREHLGLQPGDVLQVIEHEHEILLKINEAQSPIQHKDGVVVFAGKAVGDIEAAVKNERDKRLKTLLGE